MAGGMAEDGMSYKKNTQVEVLISHRFVHRIGEIYIPDTHFLGGGTGGPPALHGPQGKKM